jgi:hypothetical protein
MMSDNGTYRAYAPLTLRPKAIERIGVVNAIIEQYKAQGLSLTLRQVYYQMVARGHIANNSSEYNKLGRLVNEGRLQGLIDWQAIEDRARTLRGIRTYDSPEEAIGEIAAKYREDLWRDQQWRPEVWVEKDALSGVIQGVCNRHRVDFFACKGYVSQSEMWRAGERLAWYVQKGQRPIIFHLGDHDPSGVHMTQDNRDRLTMFAGVPVIVQRLALSMTQIEELNPPPNPAKMSDSRADDYVRMMEANGADDPYVSWELDALDPSYIDALIHDAVERIKDPDALDESLAREVEARSYLEDLAGRGGYDAEA